MNDFFIEKDTGRSNGSGRSLSGGHPPGSFDENLPGDILFNSTASMANYIKRLDAQKYVGMAKEAERNGDWTRVRENCTTALTLDSTNVDALILKRKLESHDDIVHVLVQRLSESSDFTRDEIASILSKAIAKYGEHPELVVENELNSVRQQRALGLMRGGTRAMASGYYAEASYLLEFAQKTDPNNLSIGMAREYARERANSMRLGSDSLRGTGLSLGPSMDYIPPGNVGGASLSPFVFGVGDSMNSHSTLAESVAMGDSLLLSCSTDPFDCYQKMTRGSHLRSLSASRYLSREEYDVHDNRRRYSNQSNLKEGKPEK